jgi:hypothetical protein
MLRRVRHRKIRRNDGAFRTDRAKNSGLRYSQRRGPPRLSIDRHPQEPAVDLKVAAPAASGDERMAMAKEFVRGWRGEVWSAPDNFDEKIAIYADEGALAAMLTDLWKTRFRISWISTTSSCRIWRTIELLAVWRQDCASAGRSEPSRTDRTQSRQTNSAPRLEKNVRRRLRTIILRPNSAGSRQRANQPGVGGRNHHCSVVPPPLG